MKIRKATKKDFKEIAEILIKESSKKPYNEKYTMKKAIKEISGFSKNELYISVNEKEIIGFIAFNINFSQKKAYVDELWLRPTHQGKGIGKALVKFTEDRCKKKGVKIIRLVTMRKAKAFGFYKKIKYKEYKGLVFVEKKLK